MSPARHHKQTPTAKVLNTLSSDWGIVTIAVVVILSVYYLDTITPLGQPVRLLYLIPLIVSYWSDRIYAIPVVFIATILFLIAGFLFSPQGISIQMAILNRFTFFLIFFIIALILWVIRRQQISHDNLI
jgi:hypothetical protein